MTISRTRKTINDYLKRRSHSSAPDAKALSPHVDKLRELESVVGEKVKVTASDSAWYLVHAWHKHWSILTSDIIIYGPELIEIKAKIQMIMEAMVSLGLLSQSAATRGYYAGATMVGAWVQQIREQTGEDVVIYITEDVEKNNSIQYH